MLDWGTACSHGGGKDRPAKISPEPKGVRAITQTVLSQLEVRQAEHINWYVE